MKHYANKRILFAISAMGLGHVQRSLPLIFALLAVKAQLVIVSSGAALRLLQLELAKEQPEAFIEFADYPPLQRGRGWRHYLWYLIDMLAIGRIIRTERHLVNQLHQQQPFDLIIADGRFGFWHSAVPTLLICHQIRILLPRWFRTSQWIADLGQYLTLKKYTKVLVPDIADPTKSLAGKLSSNWISRAIRPLYLGPVSGLQAAPVETVAPKDIDYLFIAGGFIDTERRQWQTWVQQQCARLPTLNIVVVNGDLQTTTIAPFNLSPNHQHFNFVAGEQRQQLMQRAKIIVGRAGYTTLMDLVQLRGQALLWPTTGMTEQQYLAQHLATQQHQVAHQLGNSGVPLIHFNYQQLPASYKNQQTEDSVRIFMQYIQELLHD